MGCAKELRPDMSITDLAYCILKNGGKPLSVKALIGEILQVKPLPHESPGRLAAQIHTEISLDSRFLHAGGEWGLRDWQPKSGAKVVRIRTVTAAPPRPRRELLPEDEYDAETDEDGADEEDDDSDDYEGDDDDLFDPDEDEE